ncbi:50S ribosomal protein L13 [Bacteroidia bacterium]|nr:50S ribosomal protein L13 [Bacteroidia bacterium]MDC0468288.1 50S ribosomal protein L13 [Bacteroidia bacterium]MDC0560775.1 50S ribosomal protein L13 [Bacteroidia bacterium]MDC3406235.1 50S ribosomal protein L13 [Bacteroidia bacterium]
MDTLSYKTISANSKTVEKQWVIVDAEGKTLGRFCSEIAKILRGKNKTNFTPHVDCGDNVIVINAEKITFTGNKMETKEYETFSGYPGGRRVALAKDLLAKKPINLIERGVRGMLPKNRLGRKLFTNMHVFVGSDHPHAAQKPTKVEI